MKKKHIVLILVVMLTLSMTTAAFAKQSGETMRGEVIEITDDDGDGYCETLIIDTDGDDGEDTETITLPEDFDCTSVAVGDYVVVAGEWIINSDGEVIFVADEIEINPEEDEDEEGEGNGWGKGGVYCAGGKEKTHPVALKIAEKYDVEDITSEWVMEQVCDGFGFGEVMLAIQTQLAFQKQNEGEGGEGKENTLGEDAEEWLNRRKAGQGWGQIWKENGIVKNDKTDNPPPGWLNKPEKEKGPKEGKGPDKGPDHPSNNSNRPIKEDKNNKNKDDEGD